MKFIVTLSDMVGVILIALLVTGACMDNLWNDYLGKHCER